MLKCFWEDHSGGTLIEYGLVVSLVAVAILITLGSLGESLDAIFGSVNSDLEHAEG